MITNDYQKLEPGNAVRLFEVDGTAFGAPDILRFHAYNIPHTEAKITAARVIRKNYRRNPSGGRVKSTVRGRC